MRRLAGCRRLSERSFEDTAGMSFQSAEVERALAEYGNAFVDRRKTELDATITSESPFVPFTLITHLIWSLIRRFCLLSSV